MKNRLKKYIHLGSLGIIIVLAVVMVNVFFSGIKTKPPVPRITLQLKWIYNAGFSGDFIAKEKGFWKDIQVDIREGGIGIDPIKVVASGQAQFGVATGDQLLMAAEKGAPVVAIALAYQENPLCWITKVNSGIVEPNDLVGKKVGLTYIDDAPLFFAMLKKVDIEEKKLTIVPVKFDLSLFKRGEVDAYPVYRNTQGTELKLALEKEGIQTTFVGPTDTGIVSYSNLYFTTRDYVEKYPQVVQEFVSGIIAGWRYAQSNVTESAKIVHKYDEENPIEIINACIVETNRLVKPTASTEIGSMTLRGWEQTQNILFASGEMKIRVDLKSVFRPEFVKKAQEK